MKKIIDVVLFLLIVNYGSALNQYEYGFGQNSGYTLVKYEGNIPILQTVTNVDLNIPQGATVTYVKVTVNAISSPKVDYHIDSNRVSIVYNWTQFTLSRYSIIVKGFTSNK